MIRDIKDYWNGQEKPRIKNVAETFAIAPLTAIYFYTKHQPNYKDSDKKLEKYIYLIGKNNFPDRPLFNAKATMEWVLPPGVTVISRKDLLKYILTCNPKTKRDPVIGEYTGQIKSLYPAVEKVETMFKEFHSLLMGNNEGKLDEYLEKYGTSEIEPFCNGIKKDITPVKNAISFSISSGFVEGNNNKFKVLKRIVYGRSGLVNLEKKCKLAFFITYTQRSERTLIKVSGSIFLLIAMGKNAAFTQKLLQAVQPLGRH